MSGPSPRRRTAKRPPLSALTRPPSTESATEKARCVLAGQRAPAVPEQHPALAVAGGDVAEAVGERVEVLAVVVGEVERLPTAARNSALVGVVPAVDLRRTCQPACSTVWRTSSTGKCAVPPVDPRLDVVRQEAGQSAHGEILSNDR